MLAKTPSVTICAHRVASAKRELLHFARGRQADGAAMLVLLDVVPNQLILQPGGVPFGEGWIWTRHLTRNREAVTTLGTNHNQTRCRKDSGLLAQAFGGGIQSNHDLNIVRH